MKEQEVQKDAVSPIIERTQDEATSRLGTIMASKPANTDASKRSNSPMNSGIFKNQRSDLFKNPLKQSYLLRLGNAYATPGKCIEESQ